jgi:glycine/D-amino acid oxidase-like deaminating enzyme
MKIVIVGGGTAAWTALSFLIRHRPQHQYVIIESSKIPTVGVGEATTGMLTALSQQLGMDLWDFMAETDALPKLAIDFQNWRGLGDQYLHPIDSSYSAHSGLDYMVYHSIATGGDLAATSRNASLAKLGLTCVGLDGDEFREVGNLTMVVDPAKLAAVLRTWCLSEGAELIDAVVNDVEVREGRVTELITDQGTVTGDIFIDCTGSHRVLSKKLDVGWKDYSRYLPVNKGMPFRLEQDTDERSACVTARAMNSGWMWEAHTRHRIGRGYVFCDRFIDQEGALRELEQHFGQTVIPIKVIDFETGVVEQHYTGNVLTLGLGAGFLEPMQATSIHASLVQISDWAAMCLTDSPESTTDPLVAKVYNQRCQRLYQDMIEFVSIHYATDRADTEFWQYVSRDLERPQKVHDMIKLAKLRLIRNDDFDQYLGSAGAPLWIYSMAGLGLFDPETCQRVLGEFHYNLDHIQGQKEIRFLELSKLRDRILTQTQLNNIFKTMTEVKDTHENLRTIG